LACDSGPSASWDRHSLCIDTATFSIENWAFGPGESLPGHAEERITDVVDELAQHSFFDDSHPVIVDTSCPLAPPNLSTTRSGQPIELVTVIGVEEPGPYRGYVFILPDDDMSELQGASDRRFAGQECLRVTEHGCVSLTVAAYLSVSELDDREVVVEAMEHATGLSQVAPRDENLTPTAPPTPRSSPFDAP
jgi:hypothetical protein